ncbi:hypothetical protein SAMN00790413_04319 [Deinococcus hopiensis KR-140]|uniref:Uncharacterized protein n=1 Tax=Deinococcus hopiensis KR-140 TaxID=695939 RepID=A0A1W1UQ53_9DEIO|nr:hypothetical protein SAMN00790413_04319 [Deinococcus hopiensis KR-140]
MLLGQLFGMGATPVLSSYLKNSSLPYIGTL